MLDDNVRYMFKLQFDDDWDRRSESEDEEKIEKVVVKQEKSTKGNKLKNLFQNNTNTNKQKKFNNTKPKPQQQTKSNVAEVGKMKFTNLKKALNQDSNPNVPAVAVTEETKPEKSTEEKRPVFKGKNQLSEELKEAQKKLQQSEKEEKKEAQPEIEKPAFVSMSQGKFVDLDSNQDVSKNK